MPNEAQAKTTVDNVSVPATLDFGEFGVIFSDSHQSCSHNGSAYKINNSVFFNEHCSDNDEIVEFEVYAERVNAKNFLEMEHNYDVYCSTPSDTESEYEDDKSESGPLKIHLQEVPHGYVVNSTVYLSDHQWNTFIFIDVKLVQCAVCEMYCDLDSCPDHMACGSHKKNLALYEPIEKYDVSITRKIQDKYHCAVCNVLFDVNDDQDHYGSKMHENNILFAINKASDIMFDYNINKENNDDNIDTNENNENKPSNVKKESDCYHFNANAINNNNNSSYVSDSLFNNNYSNDNYINFESNDYNFANNGCNDDNFESYYGYFDNDETETPINTGMSYATMAKKPKIIVQKFLNIDLGNKKVRVKFDSWHMIISPKSNNYYCMVCKKFDHIRLKSEHCSDVDHLMNLEKCKVVEDYEEYFIRQVDDKLYHCGHCNNLQLIHEMEDHVDSNHPRKTKIVADSTKNTNSDPETPIKNTNNDILPNTPIRNINNGSVTPKKNTNKDILPNTPIRNINNGSVTPKKNTNKDIQPKSPTRNRNDNLETAIRNTNNDIPPQSPVRNLNSHLPAQEHQRDSRSATPNLIDESIENKTNNDKQKPAIINNDKKVKQDAANNSVNNANSFNEAKIKKAASVYDNLVIYPFGYKMTVPLMAYNVVCSRPNDFFCGLCNIICQEDLIMGHIFDLNHTQLLQRTPFISPFSCNLIRAIRDALHCTICNMPIAVNKIYPHIRDPQHVMSLTQALGIPQTSTSVKKILTETDPGLCDASIDPNAVKRPKKASKDIKINSNAAQDVNLNCSDVNIESIAHKDIKTAKDDAEIAINIATEAKIGSNSCNTVITDNDAKDIAYNMQIPTRVESTQPQVEVNTQKFIEVPVNKHFENMSEEIEDSDEYEDMNDTIDSIDPTFDMEEYVYLKLKNTYIKIANTSYNTLVHVGDGSRYCFVCALQVDFVELQRHVDSRAHLENMEEYRFLDKYEDHLLRQIYLMYHCSICNVLITRKELKTHLEWPTHALQNETTQKNIKKTRKNEIKGGVKQIVVSTQKENIYLNEKEPVTKILLNVEVTRNVIKTKTSNVPAKAGESEGIRKNKIIIFNDNVLKVSWESWQGVSKAKNGCKCLLCQKELKATELESHCNTEWHRYSLDKPFEKQFAPALIRKINDSTLNCLICNTEVSNKDHILSEHINGKKHIKNYEAILNESSLANTYTDCHNDVLMLDN